MKALMTVLLLVFLSGCAGQPTVGNLTKASATQRAFNQQLATEAAAQLHQLYAPATTTFVLGHLANDEFGQHLVKSLRDNGFAVAEFNSNAAGEPFAYVVDYAGEQTLLITLRVGRTVTSRLYETQNNRLAALGSWSRLE